ncbi:protein fem-1 homolog CG6966 isoform X2 [Diabrotica virgifera virgifera]|uniref:Protein fem-1 homolog C n=2 Tax=Diabrotica virgifera virgifera TaxID=50390 RepID=A0ABM5L587_DIAVI|nr:protein fem-1 homolog CG6966 isoform X2 [Diabrotica virgifera virgifera]
MKKLDPITERDLIFHELIEECKHAVPGAMLPYGLRNRLEKCSPETRRDIVNRVKKGCSPLFIACKKGQTEIVEYLLTVCSANVEQKGLFEVQEDRSTHVVTPLWCAAVSGKLEVVQALISNGANINAVSDTGSTAVRSACYMTHFEIVKYLVTHGADINRANFNGGTCLINSVQSTPLCAFLLKNGANVNARDIQNKSALHYAIQEHRLETTQLLLQYGADYNAKSRYGDDALQMACLKGSTRIFKHLLTTFLYPTEKIVDAHELMGATFLDEHSEWDIAVQHWKTALRIRQAYNLFPKQPVMEPQEGYRFQKEFETFEDLENIMADEDSMRMQSLIIAERILGTYHKDTIFRLMYRGAAYADVLRYQRSIDIWKRALIIRIEKDTVLYTDTCFAAQALVRLMMDYHIKCVKNGDDKDRPRRFYDIMSVFNLLTHNISEIRLLLNIRPVYKRQLDFFDKLLKCIAHLIYLMVESMSTEDEVASVRTAITNFVRKNIRCVQLGDTILHMCVSKLNTIRSNYFMNEEPIIIFPKASIVHFLLECGASVNERNEQGQTPLHISTLTYNYSEEVVKLLLQYGAHIDIPNIEGKAPIEAIECLKPEQKSNINLLQYLSLKCVCATVIATNKIPYTNQIPKTLEQFVKLHEP